MAERTVLPKPDVEVFARRVLIWNPETREWEEGRRTDVLIPRPVEELVWTNTGVATNVTPDVDKELDVLYAQRIAIQVDTTHASHTSTDTDLNVMATLDGFKWDSVPYAERNIGDNQVKTFLIEVSVKKIRLRLDNNTSASTAYATARVLIVR